MSKFIACLTPVVFIILLAGWCQAKEQPKVTEQRSCVVVVSFQTLDNGSTVVRKQWVCESEVK